MRIRIGRHLYFHPEEYTNLQKARIRFLRTLWGLANILEGIISVLSLGCLYADFGSLNALASASKLEITFYKQRKPK